MTCDDVRADAAAALLSSTPLDDEVQAHLDACPPCREEVAELVAVVGLLPLAGIDGPEAVGRADELGLRRLLATASGQAQRRRRRTWGVAAAAVTVAALAVAGGVVLGGTDSPATVVSTSATDPGTGVSGRVHVTPADSGSRLAFEVSGVAAGTTCRLVVVDTGGRRHAVSTWTAEYDGEAAVTTSSTLPVSEVSAVQLVDVASGEPLLTLIP